MRRSVHSWREPSPDVWSIEEEPDAEHEGDMDDSIVQDGREAKVARAHMVDVAAAKPKKRVRFLLPAREA